MLASLPLAAARGRAGSTALHWCALLSEGRTVMLPDVAWRVHIDDYDIAWSEKRRVFDPIV